MTVSQHVLEKRALKAQFEEAMCIFTVEEENKQLKINQECNAHERDAFYVKIEQLQKQLDRKESELDLKKKRTEQLESGAVVIDVVFQKTLEEFYQSDAWFSAQKDLRITTGKLLLQIT